jgi:hypothetical protein
MPMPSAFRPSHGWDDLGRVGPQPPPPSYGGGREGEGDTHVLRLSPSSILPRMTGEEVQEAQRKLPATTLTLRGAAIHTATAQTTLKAMPSPKAMV